MSEPLTTATTPGFCAAAVAAGCFCSAAQSIHGMTAATVIANVSINVAILQLIFIPFLLRCFMIFVNAQERFWITTRFARGTEGTEECHIQALIGYGETTISDQPHPSGIEIFVTLREASVCIRNRISTVPDTILSS